MIPRKRRSRNKVKANVKFRNLVQKAAKEGQTNVIVDGRPCSLEIGRSTSGILSWKVKIYSQDAKEVLESVKDVKEIEKEINKLK